MDGDKVEDAALAVRLAFAVAVAWAGQFRALGCPGGPRAVRALPDSGPRLPPAQAFYAAVQQAGGDDASSFVSETQSYGSAAPSSAAGPAWANSLGNTTIAEDAPYDAPLPPAAPLYSAPAAKPGRTVVSAPAEPYAVPVGHYEPSVAGSFADGGSTYQAPSYAPSLVAGRSYAPSFAASEVRGVTTAVVLRVNACTGN